MARKSNKTAHVLNLIAGHEAPAESTEETLAAGDTPAKTAPAAAPASAPAQNISVIDTTENDPVADLIQQKLSNELEAQTKPAEAEPVVTAQPAAEQAVSESSEASATAQIEAAAKLVPEVSESSETAAADQIEAAAKLVPEPQTVSESQAEAAPQTASTPLAASTPPTEIEPETATESAPEPAPIPEPEPEPDFVRINVIEEIVKDKIIYFMRQFDVCTCERCIQDTIALTLNGILPKYIVTTPAAVDPLLSFYTNRYITDVTVEATKACMIVKENPRH